MHVAKLSMNSQCLLEILEYLNHLLEKQLHKGFDPTEFTVLSHKSNYLGANIFSFVNRKQKASNVGPSKKVKRTYLK